MRHVVALALCLVTLSACGLLGRGSKPERSPGWEARAVAAVESSPGITNPDVEVFTVDAGMGDATKIGGTVDLTGAEPRADYERMLRNLTAALGPSANIGVDIRGRVPRQRTISQTDLGIYVATSDELYRHFHGGGSAPSS